MPSTDSIEHDSIVVLKNISRNGLEKNHKVEKYFSQPEFAGQKIFFCLQKNNYLTEIGANCVGL
jgi:hypothetical protein